MLLKPAGFVVFGLFLCLLVLALQAAISGLRRHDITKVRPTFSDEICSVNIPLNARLNPDQKILTLQVFVELGWEPLSCVNIFASTSWRIYQFYI